MVSFYFSPNRKVTEWDRNQFVALVHREMPVREYITFPHSKGVHSLDHEIDFLMRFESLQEDFKTVCEHLKIDNIVLPHRNKSSRKHYSYYYDSDLIQLVKNKFLDEIEFGAYTFEKE